MVGGLLSGDWFGEVVVGWSFVVSVVGVVGGG